MIKKLLVFVAILLMGLLSSCNNLDGVKLPNLSGKTQAEIKEIMNALDITYEFKIKKDQYYSEQDYDRFYEYDNGLMAGNVVAKGTHIYIYTTPLHLTGHYVDEVKIDFDYIDKDFSEDGVGIVTLERAIDGDTAYFYDLSGDHVKVRFLGVDTPESTKQQDPWGKAASKFTANILKNAKEIVLLQEGNETDTYGRTLAFVFADGILVNLYLIQEAYSNSTLGGKSRYFDVFMRASMETSKTGRRFWGELDPNYNY